MDALARRQAELTALFKRLYEDNVPGHIPDDQYRILSQGYTEEQKQIKERLPIAEARPEKMKSTATNVSRFIENAKRYSQIDELTSEKHSRNAVQEIKIYYRDVGLLDDMLESTIGEVALAAEDQITAEVA